MPETIRPDDPRLTWQGAISFHDTAEWRIPWRIPAELTEPEDALRQWPQQQTREPCDHQRQQQGY